MHLEDLIKSIDDTVTITPEEAHMMGHLTTAALESEGDERELIAMVPTSLLPAFAIIMSTGLETLRKDGRIKA